jgi:AraC family transcriptional regulator, arabinose operon regulatory protein
MKDIHFSDQFLNKKMFDLRTLGIDQNPPKQITEFGFFPQAKYHYIRRDKGAPENIFILCSQGEGVVEYNHRTFQIVPRSYIIIPKNISHIYFSKNDNPWSIYWFHFIDDIRLPSGVRMLSTIHYNCVIAAFQLLLSKDYHIPENVAYLGLTYQYIYETLRQDNAKPISNEHVDMALQYMKSHVSDTISLQDIADYCHVSSSQISHLFKEQFGSSPFSHFLKLKVDYAASLILLTKLTMKEIALQVGIEDQFYFSRLFKRHLGMSPLTFRRHNQ